MGVKRTLQRNQQAEPMIIFIPQKTTTFDKVISKCTDAIIVTNPTIYKRVFEVVSEELYRQRAGIIRKERKNDRSE